MKLPLKMSKGIKNVYNVYRVVLKLQENITLLPSWSASMIKWTKKMLRYTKTMSQMNLLAGSRGPAQTPSQNVINYLYCWSAYVATCGQRVVVNAMVEFALTLVKARLG